MQAQQGNERQWRPWQTLGGRLLLTFLLVGLIPVAVVTFLSFDRASDIITNEVEVQLFTASRLKVEQVETFLTDAQEDANTVATRLVVTGDGTPENQLGIPAFDANLANPEGEGYQAAYAQSQARLAGFVGDNAVDLTLQNADGVVVYSHNGRYDLGTDISDAEWFGAEIFGVAFNPALNTNVVSLTRPVFETGTGQEIGSIVLHLDSRVLETFLTDPTIFSESETFESYLVNQNGLMLTASRFVEDAILSQDVNTDATRTEALLPGETQYIGEYTSYHEDVVLGAATFLPDVEWTLVTEIARTDALSPVDDLVETNLIFAGVAALFIVALALFTANQITRPVNQLRRKAEAFAAGENIDIRVDAGGERELTALSEAFDQMATQLRESIGALESRVERRTRDLQTILDVNRQVTTVLNVERVLQDVVDLTKERFGLYHAHIYAMSEDREALVLTSGAGHTGRQMVAEERVISLDNLNSVVVQAARTREPIVINDVRDSELFLPHPLLPDTRSELAIALVARGRLLGVLDVQSDQPNYFNEDIIEVLDILSAQVSAALYNAQLFESAERTSRHEQALGTVERQMQSAQDIDEAIQIAVRELGKALRVPHTAIQLKLASTRSENGHTGPLSPSVVERQEEGEHA